VNLKSPLTIDEQVARLIQHGLIIKNKKEAAEFLSEINYYRFTGYALQYRVSPHQSDYINNVTFKHILDLYQFDAELRTLLRKYLEIIEHYFRTRISYCFSVKKCQLPPHNQHYDKSNYYRKDRFDEVLKSFERERDYQKNSLIVTHHSNNYENQMPMWVMVELMSFSNLSKLYGCMYYSEQREIANHQKISPRMLSNHLHGLSVLRNKCAHGARLYNVDFNPPTMLKKSFLKKYPNIRNNTLFAYLLPIVLHLPREALKDFFINELDSLIDRYADCIELKIMGFPQSYKTLLNYTNNLS